MIGISIKNKIKIFFNCKIFGMHDWTSKSMQNIKLTKEDIDLGYEGIKSYSKMYCKDCGKVSKLSL